MGIRCADHVTPLFPQTLALTSPTGGGRSVGIVRLRTKATELVHQVGVFIRMSQVCCKNCILCISESVSDQQYVTGLMLIKMLIMTWTIYQDTLWQSSPHIIAPFVTDTKLYVKQRTRKRDQKWVQYSDKSLNHFYSNSNKMQQLLKFIFGITLYMFWTIFLSIIRSSRLYIEQQVYVRQVLLSAC